MYGLGRQATEYRLLTKLLEKLPSESSVDATQKLLLCLSALVRDNAEGQAQFTAQRGYRQGPPPATNGGGCPAFLLSGSSHPPQASGAES